MPGFILHYKNTVTSSGNGVYIHSVDTEKDRKNGWQGVNRTNMSAVGGFGLKCAKGQGAIIFDITYVYGFSIINTNQVLSHGYAFNYQRGLNFSIGYALKLHKQQ